MRMMVVGGCLIQVPQLTVMSSKHLGLYKAQCEETYDGSLYRAANGTTVDMHGQAEVCAWVALHDWRTDAVKHRRARLRTLVADIRSNIISTTTLCAAGWSKRSSKRIVHYLVRENLA